jgi:hypothetical protein
MDRQAPAAVSINLLNGSLTISKPMQPPALTWTISTRPVFPVMGKLSSDPFTPTLISLDLASIGQ